MLGAARLVLPPHRLVKKLTKAAMTPGSAGLLPLATGANRGSVLKRRWPRALCTYLVVGASMPAPVVYVDRWRLQAR